LSKKILSKTYIKSIDILLKRCIISNIRNRKYKSPEVSKMIIKRLRNAKFGTNKTHVVVTGWALYEEGKGYIAYSSDRDKYGILAPYIPCGGKRALQAILNAGGFTSFEGVGRGMGVGGVAGWRGGKVEDMTIKDLEFEKIQNYDPYNDRAKSNGMVTEWVARNGWGNAVAFGYTKAECVADARRYCKYN